MPELALRPRSPTELVDAAFQVYRRAPLQFMVALAVVYVPWLVIRLALDINIDPASIPPPATIATIAFAGIAIYAVAGGVITVIARDVYLDLAIDVREAFRVVATRLVTLIVASAITVVLIAAGAILLLVATALRFVGVATLGLVVAGLLMLLVWAPYVVARLVVVRQVIMLEDAGTGRALARSSALSVGLKLHVLGTLALIVLLLVAVNVGAGLLISIIPSRVIVNVLSTTLSVVVGPLLGIAETVLYYDLRIRREGFDVEYLVGRDTPPPPSSANVAI